MFEEYDTLGLVSFNISLYNHILWGLSQHFLPLGRVLVSKWGLRPNTKAQVFAPHNIYSLAYVKGNKKLYTWEIKNKNLPTQKKKALLLGKINL